MFDFPRSTKYGRSVPKSKFYEKAKVSAATKRAFVDQVDRIVWSCLLAERTFNVARGERVLEIEVFRVVLRGRDLDDAVLDAIEEKVPYPILFILEYEGRFQTRISLKTASKSGEAFKIARRFRSDWFSEGESPIKIDGLDLDAVYDNFVRQVAGRALPDARPGETVAETASRADQIAKLQKEVARLQGKIRQEKQLNRRMELGAEYKRAQKELETLK